MKLWQKAGILGFLVSLTILLLYFTLIRKWVIVPWKIIMFTGMSIGFGLIASGIGSIYENRRIGWKNGAIIGAGVGIIPVWLWFQAFGSPGILDLMLILTLPVASIGGLIGYICEEGLLRAWKRGVLLIALIGNILAIWVLGFIIYNRYGKPGTILLGLIVLALFGVALWPGLVRSKGSA